MPFQRSAVLIYLCCACFYTCEKFSRAPSGVLADLGRGFLCFAVILSFLCFVFRARKCRAILTVPGKFLSCSGPLCGCPLCAGFGQLLFYCLINRTRALPDPLFCAGAILPFARPGRFHRLPFLTYRQNLQPAFSAPGSFCRFQKPGFSKFLQDLQVLKSAMCRKWSVFKIVFFVFGFFCRRRIRKFS